MDFPYRPTDCKSSNESADDPEMQLLIGAIHKGWPLRQKDCPAELVPYYDSRSELVGDGGLVYRGERLVVPQSLRADMFKEIHRSHIGIGGCLRRARELLYWPRINAEVKDYVSKCSVCQSYQPEQCREELQPHELPSRPWSKVGADIFELGPQQFLIMVDNWSNYFEVQELKGITSASVIHALKVQFARHGIPEVLVTDNRTQFSSSEFANFAETWRFERKTSSPRYPQSNGKAENAVKVCKALLKKARADNKDPLLAFLDWRNTPIRRSRNLTSSTSDGQTNTNAVANPHQTAGAKSRQPDRRQVGKAQSHTRAAVQLEESTINTVTARSSDQDETPW